MRQKHWAAFEDFARVHGDSLVRLSFVLSGDRGKAEDAAQEALTGVYLRWGRLDDPLSYARRSVVNATKDQWRHLGRRDRLERTAAWQPQESPPLLDDVVADRDRLIQALRRLSYGQRAVIVLRYWLQLSEQETARALGNSAGTVKSQASRALARLREELQSDLLPVNPKE
ncbi:MAG TPA: SigE family RNA polymerase sigma factor [Streptosporangiaceae bacterium]|nr:SigE family RNA polymerase sigma factor [Streptosporangiaceae bacterium]